MRLYAQNPGRRLRQVVGDLLVIAWVIAWVQAGRWVHDVIGRLAAPGRTLETAGSSLEGSLSSAGERVSRVPLLGDDVRAPFDAAGGAAASIARAGVQVQQGAEQLALMVALAVAVTPIVLVVAAWVLGRVRFARRAAAASRILDSAADLDLFALRALATQPVTVLARVDDDPAGAWRRGDPDVVRALARLELRSLGLRTPADTSAGTSPGGTDPGGADPAEG